LAAAQEWNVLIYLRERKRECEQKKKEILENARVEGKSSSDSRKVGLL
jgi:hypothetical protein